MVGLLLAMMPALGHRVAAQDSVKVAPPTVLGGALTVTTKGISTVPSFTLGKPAAILDISIVRGGLSFEPQFRMGLDGKPWAFLFWGRYRLAGPRAASRRHRRPSGALVQVVDGDDRWRSSAISS